MTQQAVIGGLASLVIIVNSTLFGYIIYQLYTKKWAFTINVKTASVVIWTINATLDLFVLEMTTLHIIATVCSLIGLGWSIAKPVTQNVNSSSNSSSYN